MFYLWRSSLKKKLNILFLIILFSGNIVQSINGLPAEASFLREATSSSDEQLSSFDANLDHEEAPYVDEHDPAKTTFDSTQDTKKTSIYAKVRAVCLKHKHIIVGTAFAGLAIFGLSWMDIDFGSFFTRAGWSLKSINDRRPANPTAKTLSYFVNLYPTAFKPNSMN